MSVTFHDMFCGAGGSTLGAHMAGARPVVGLNHWQVACDSYEANHAPAGAVAACVDVVTQDPRRYPPADMLLASPECTHHSYARGRPKDDASLFDPHGDKGAERSRATMWDVVRFAEVHAYRLVVVENVEAAVKWGLRRGQKLRHGDYGPLFAAWLNAMAALGYEHRLVHLNSMVCGVPQSRDRLYVVFWRRGQRAPDLEVTALAWCPSCDGLVHGEQRFKKPGATTGVHGQQYVYACPGCGTGCALAVRPAAAAIDWTLEAVRIGERSKPLAAATVERIRRGLLKLRDRPATVRLPDGLVVQVGANTFERAGYARAWSTDEPLRTVTATADRALVVSNMEHGVPRLASDEAAATVTTGNKLGLVVPAGGNPADARPLDQAMHTIVGSDRLAVVIEHRGGREHSGNVPRLPDGEPLGTVSAQGTHHALLIANYGMADSSGRGQGWARHVDDGPVGAVTATDSHALFTYRGDGDARPVAEPASTITTVEQHALLGDVTQEHIDACTFRMLQPHELKLASGFTSDYVLTGKKRDQVAQIGNAVTAPAEAELVRRCMESIA